MTFKKQLKQILNKEVDKYSHRTYEELLEFQAPKSIEIIENGIRCFLEIQLLEKKSEYLHVLLTIDDGSFLSAVFPASKSFIKRKESQGQTK